MTDVLICRNGMVIVFDEKGQQVPEFQGCIFEVMENIGKVADEDTVVRIASCEQLNTKWWFKNKRGTPPLPF